MIISDDDGDVEISTSNDEISDTRRSKRPGEEEEEEQPMETTQHHSTHIKAFPVAHPLARVQHKRDLLAGSRHAPWLRAH